MTAVEVREDATQETPVASGEATPKRRRAPSGLGWLPRVLVLAAVAALVLLAPVLLDDRAADLAAAPIYAIIALSLNVLIGYTGTISLGHHAFVGIGAFTTAYVVGQHQHPFLLGVAVAALLGGLQALFLGGLALRISGLYFALITLSYGVLAQESLFNITSLTGAAPAPPHRSPPRSGPTTTCASASWRSCSTPIAA